MGYSGWATVGWATVGGATVGEATVGGSIAGGSTVGEVTYVGSQKNNPQSCKSVLRGLLLNWRTTTELRGLLLN